MSHVNVTINSRQYRMACEDGQEDRLLKLAGDLESRIGQLRGKFGAPGAARGAWGELRALRPLRSLGAVAVGWLSNPRPRFSAQQSRLRLPQATVQFRPEAQLELVQLASGA